MHATEFLSSSDPFQPVPVLVLFGSERFLKREVLQRIPGCHGDEADLSLVRFDGDSAEFRHVMSELSTVSMFGDQRIVLVEGADDFVSEHRAALEKYVARPSRASLLILDVQSWPKSTRLYKAVEATGLALECSELKGAALVKWLQRMASQGFQKQLEREAAALMVHLAGDNLGLLQQEVNKVAAYVGEAGTITPEDVAKVVGGWRMETT